MWEISGAGEGEVGAGGKRGGKGGLRGGRGDSGAAGVMTSVLEFGVHMFTRCSKRFKITHFPAYLGGGGRRAGCVYSSKLIEHSSLLLENYSARSSPSLCEI